MTLEDSIKNTVRDIVDFPIPGIIFKDITPVLKDSDLCKRIVDAFCVQSSNLKIDAVAAVESRGFLFGMLIAQELKVPFIPIRKKGKLPYDTFEQTYDLEYGNATIEIHKDAILKGQHILLHDDLLATGGTMDAASKLVLKAGGTIAAYSFLINLSYLNGATRLSKYSNNFLGLVNY